jgi:hypothetical protein
MILSRDSDPVVVEHRRRRDSNPRATPKSRLVRGFAGTGGASGSTRRAGCPGGLPPKTCAVGIARPQCGPTCVPSSWPSG